jgi:hypothetical protein
MNASSGITSNKMSETCQGIHARELIDTLINTKHVPERAASPPDPYVEVEVSEEQWEFLSWLQMCLIYFVAVLSTVL